MRRPRRAGIPLGSIRGRRRTAQRGAPQSQTSQTATQTKPQDTDQRERERASPARGQRRHHQRGHDGADGRAGVEDSVAEAPVLWRQDRAGDAQGAGPVERLADAEQARQTISIAEGRRERRRRSPPATTRRPPPRRPSRTFQRSVRNPGRDLEQARTSSRNAASTQPKPVCEIDTPPLSARRPARSPAGPCNSGPSQANISQQTPQAQPRVTDFGGLDDVSVPSSSITRVHSARTVAVRGRGDTASRAQVSGDDFDVGIFVESQDGDLAVVLDQLQGRLMAVEGLAAHLDAADGTERFGGDGADHLRHPLPVADPHLLHDADSGSRGVFRFGERRNHHSSHGKCVGPVGRSYGNCAGVSTIRTRRV